MYLHLAMLIEFILLCLQISPICWLWFLYQVPGGSVCSLFGKSSDMTEVWNYPVFETIKCLSSMRTTTNFELWVFVNFHIPLHRTRQSGQARQSWTSLRQGSSQVTAPSQSMPGRSGEWSHVGINFQTLVKLLLLMWKNELPVLLHFHCLFIFFAVFCSPGTYGVLVPFGFVCICSESWLLGCFCVQ